MGDQALANDLAKRGIDDRRVLDAIASLERASFVPPAVRLEATADQPLPIGFGQTISQPFIVAYMSQALALKPGERVLEVGTGSGYQAAVLARLGAEVYTIEIVPELAAAARERLTSLGLHGIHVRQGDGTLGWPEAAPFDAVILTAAPARIPEALLAQLRPEGRLLAPVGGQQEPQQLVLVHRTPEGGTAERLLTVRFVPMTHGAPLRS
jgi:protein-L-isoaspartate(D-aspartate) O-methyltransferase